MSFDMHDTISEAFRHARLKTEARCGFLCSCFSRGFSHDFVPMVLYSAIENMGSSSFETVRLYQFRQFGTQSNDSFRFPPI
jgi:hypothetical protein